MLRIQRPLRSAFWTISALALALSTSIFLAAPSFADQAAPVSAESSGGSSTGAGSSGPGSAGAGISSNTNTSASVGDNASANANTTGGAVTGQAGDGQASGAGATTSATANAYNDGTTPIADAQASAGAGGGAVDGPSASVAVAGSGSDAAAHAEGGNSPTATASAGSSSAAATAGKNPTTTATIATEEDVTTKTKTKGNQSLTIAYVSDGQYSVAFANKKVAVATSGTLGTGVAVNAKNVWAAALTWASAYAKATQTSAFASASAGASGAGGTSRGVSAAASSSQAMARITIRLFSNDTASSGGTASMQCTVRVISLEKLKKVKADQRYRYLACSCPIGWRNAPGKNSYACVPNSVAAGKAATGSFARGLASVSRNIVTTPRKTGTTANNRRSGGLFSTLFSSRNEAAIYR